MCLVYTRQSLGSKALVHIGACNDAKHVISFASRTQEYGCTLIHTIVVIMCDCMALSIWTRDMPCLLQKQDLSPPDAAW